MKRSVRGAGGQLSGSHCHGDTLQKLEEDLEKEK